MGSQELYQALRPFCDKINSVVEARDDISIITHLDADGIAAGSIVFLALSRLGAKCTIRTISDINPDVIEEMKSEGRDFYIIVDLGSGIGEELRMSLGDKWVIIDHHQITGEEARGLYSDQILNAWKYGIDGSNEISSGGMAYMFANVLDKKNKDLSAIAVISALGDRQDQGDKKSFTGVNSEILKAAQSLNLVDVNLDLLFTGRETSPLHEAIAYTSFPYIYGLTWNKENAYSIIKNTGIKTKDDGRWRVLSDFSQEEKSIILDAVARFIIASSKSTAGNMSDELVGYKYTLTREDTQSYLRDARDFATLLNACGRIRKAGVGVAVCMGDRSTILAEGEEIASNYRATLRKYISAIFNEKWRLIDDGVSSIFINGEGLIVENMLGAISSVLAGSPSLSGRLLFVRTLSQDGYYKFSSRKCIGCISKLNLGLLMKNHSEYVGGSGGGHHSAAGCRIPSSRLEDFLSKIRSVISNNRFSDSSSSSS
jgi:single-stranded-DNA-specific exonuclease